jgi:hypothetical protein
MILHGFLAKNSESSLTKRSFARHITVPHTFRDLQSGVGSSIFQRFYLRVHGVLNGFLLVAGPVLGYESVQRGLGWDGIGAFSEAKRCHSMQYSEALGSWEIDRKYGFSVIEPDVLPPHCFRNGNLRKILLTLSMMKLHRY